MSDEKLIQLMKDILNLEQEIAIKQERLKFLKDCLISRLMEREDG